MCAEFKLIIKNINNDNKVVTLWMLLLMNKISLSRDEVIEGIGYLCHEEPFLMGKVKITRFLIKHGKVKRGYIFVKWGVSERLGRAAL